MDELSTWEMVSDINLDSVRYEDGGIVYFSAKGPDGNDVRFWEYNVEPSTGGLKINTEGRICSLDSFGRIYSIDCVVNDYTDVWMEFIHGERMTYRKICIQEIWIIWLTRLLAVYPCKTLPRKRNL